LLYFEKAESSRYKVTSKKVNPNIIPKNSPFKKFNKTIIPEGKASFSLGIITTKEKITVSILKSLITLVHFFIYKLKVYTFIPPNIFRFTKLLGFRLSEQHKLQTRTSCFFCGGW